MSKSRGNTVNPMELFEQFYKMQNHIDLDEKRAQMAISIFEEVIR